MIWTPLHPHKGNPRLTLVTLFQSLSVLRATLIFLIDLFSGLPLEVPSVAQTLPGLPENCHMKRNRLSRSLRVTMYRFWHMALKGPPLQMQNGHSPSVIRRKPCNFRMTNLQYHQAGISQAPPYIETLSSLHSRINLRSRIIPGHLYYTLSFYARLHLVPSCHSPYLISFYLFIPFSLRPMASYVSSPRSCNISRNVMDFQNKICYL